MFVYDIEYLAGEPRFTMKIKQDVRKKLFGLLPGTALCSVLCGSALLPAMADYPVAGLAPDQRPAGAPVIEWVQRNKSWYEHALTGIDRPYPRSLYFLDNQGYWYTPFTHPGMKGVYDIRGWHR